MEYSAVVKVFATSQAYDFGCPWQSLSPNGGTGSGVVIDAALLLTSAHVVANATFVQVQKCSSSEKFTAHVEAVCHDSDLALLRVESPHFMEGIVPAEIGALPNHRDRVSVVGFPIGGEDFSITEGVVSRIEVQEYSHSQRHLLAVTVDAAINEGNSGGPVFKGGEVVGLAFQGLRNAQSIGEVVPTPLIRQFLRGKGNARVTNVPGLGIRTQKLENASLRKHLGLKSAQTGLLVTEVAPDNSCEGVLQEGDVITAIDQYQIDNNGTIRYKGEFRTEYPVVLGEYLVGEELSFDLIRNGKQMTLSTKLRKYEMLVPLNQYETAPSYFIFGGFVFQILCRDFLRCWDDWWDRAPKEFLYEYYFGIPSKERKEVVIISRVLAHEVNVGYEETYNVAVNKVNGVTIRDLRQLFEVLRSSETIVDIETSIGTHVVLHAEQANNAGLEILERYNIHAGYSSDLKDIALQKQRKSA
ncbi:MAG: serine protease [Myxococcota bacterium]|nr:serine protease [Myxococcota bacterium]